MTGKTGKVMGKRGEVVAETGHVTGELDECGVEVSEWRLATMKRCSKRNRGSKTGLLQTAAMVKHMCPTAVRHHTQISYSQQNKLYPAKMYKLFLQHTKGMKGLDLEKHFPDKLPFC